MFITQINLIQSPCDSFVICIDVCDQIWKWSMLRNFGEYGQHQVYESIVQRRVGCHPALWLQRERNRETHYRNITPMSQVSTTWCRTLWCESNDSRDGTTYTSQLWNPVELQLRTGWHATRVSRFPVHSFFFFLKSKIFLARISRNKWN